VKKNAEQFEDHLPPAWAVVVTYQPDISLLENLHSLLPQFQRVIIVDNGSAPGPAEILAAAEKLAGVQLIRNGENLGIATALNTGIRLALENGCVWVATFDQDTAIPENYVRSMLDVRAACPDAGRVGIIVPGCCVRPQAPSAASLPATASRFVRGGISSGSLILAAVFPAAGFYDDAMFIDYVDMEFCLRLQKKGFFILSATNVGIYHELGTAQTRNLLGLRLTFRIHTAWRYYYIMRNRVVLFRRYGLIFPSWALHDASQMLKELMRMACLEKERIVKLRCAAHGIWDGLRGKLGRHPQFPRP
jgi:rhamnosyltransferase